MSLKLELKSFELGGVAPYGWAPLPGQWNGSIMGHEFTMVGTFKLIWKTDFFSKGKDPTVDTLPRLIWREKEFWWERKSSGDWEYKGETDKGDLYQTSPGSPTWGGFRQGGHDVRDYVWLSDPGINIPVPLRAKLLTQSQQGLVTTASNIILSVKTSQKYREFETLANTRGHRNEGEIKQWWLIAEKLADKDQRIPCPALDRPGMALDGGSGQSGGGHVSLTTARSRRRVLQFDLGIVGSAQRFSATQVLETLDGQPAISKFIIPGQTDSWCKAIPDKYLQYWRSKLNKNDAYDQTMTLEPENAVDAWLAQHGTTSTTTPWTPGVKPRPGWVRGQVPGR